MLLKTQLSIFFFFYGLGWGILEEEGGEGKKGVEQTFFSFEKQRLNIMSLNFEKSYEQTSLLKKGFDSKCVVENLKIAFKVCSILSKRIVSVCELSLKR